MQRAAARSGRNVWQFRVARPAAFFLGGLVAATGQAPWGLWWLAFPALVAGIGALAAEPGVRRAALLGWLAGAGYFAGTLFWIVEPFLVDAARDGWMAPFALVFTAFGMALFWGVAAGLAAWLGRDRRERALALAVTLAAAELARSYLFTGFPWALLGHLWIGLPQMQAAAVVGPIGLTLLATLAAALPFAVPRGPGRAGGAVAALVLVLVPGFWGAARLAAPPADRAEPVRVRLLQPNAPQRLKWRRDMIPVYFRRQLAMTAAPGDPAPDLVVWPETSVAYRPRPGSAALARISAAAGARPVVFGALRRTEAGVYNSLFALGPDGGVAARYDKHHLVPFGEYVPAFAEWLGIGKLAGIEGGYAAGPGPRVLDLGAAGKVLPLICYEAIFPQDVGRAPERADWILQITNDAWFGRLVGPYQHLAQARLRAVEQGLPLLRSANTGVSAVVDARGRVRERLALGKAGKLDVAVPGALPPTLYARTGDWPAGAVLVVALAALATRRLRVRGRSGG